MTRPLIGITGRRWPASRLAEFLPSALHDAEFDLHFTEYPAAVTRAGGIAVELTRDAPVRECLARLDGVIVSGGADVDPAKFGAPPDPKAGPFEPDRDDWELRVIAAAIELDVPLLGICRGAQLLQVHFGGNLNQHVDRSFGDGHPRFDEDRSKVCHSVRTLPGTLAERLYATETMVNSLHHQTIDTPAVPLVASGASPDGTIEVLELPGKEVFAVQWHPEMLLDVVDPSLLWLVEAATRRLESR
jgi:putative glutamine amidotransferase